MWKSQSTFKKTKQKKKTNKSLKHSGLWLMDRRLTCPRLMKWGKKKELLMVQSISSAKYYCMRTSLLVPMIWLPTAQLLLLFFLLFFLFYFLDTIYIYIHPNDSKLFWTAFHLTDGQWWKNFIVMGFSLPKSEMFFTS